MILFLILFVVVSSLQGMESSKQPDVEIIRISGSPVPLRSITPIDDAKIQQMRDLIVRKYLKKDVPIKRIVAAKLESQLKAASVQALEDEETKKGVVALKNLIEGSSRAIDKKDALKLLNELVLQASQETIDENKDESDKVLTRFKVIGGIIIGVLGAAVPFVAALVKVFGTNCP